MSRAIPLVCSCGTLWTQQDLDTYNQGSIEYAVSRHLKFWQQSGIAHKIHLTETGKDVSAMALENLANKKETGSQETSQ